MVTFILDTFLSRHDCWRPHVSLRLTGSGEIRQIRLPGPGPAVKASTNEIRNSLTQSLFQNERTFLYDIKNVRHLSGTFLKPANLMAEVMICVDDFVKSFRQRDRRTSSQNDFQIFSKASV
jgi:hypothetical protein